MTNSRLTTCADARYARDQAWFRQNHKQGGIGSVYDRNEYADENKRVMEAVAAHIMALVEGRGGDTVVRINERKGRR